MELNRRAVDLLIEQRCRECRDDFSLFRATINKNHLSGWFQKIAEDNLSQFYFDFIGGKRPKLILQTPPQHGKSSIIVDFCAWVAGKNPDKKTIYTSFSERLGIRANLKMQRIMDGDVYKRIFPDTKLSASNVVTISGQHLRNREILEYVGHDGYFRNTTVQGSITGEGLDLGIIDDPLKGRREANSETTRNWVWDWLTDDFFSRFSDDAALLMILTRWHLDDPAGRMMKNMHGVKSIHFPALADDDAVLHELDIRKPLSGEALFPELKSAEFLRERKELMTKSGNKYSWLSLYQQTPIQRGGDLIRGEWFGRHSHDLSAQGAIIFADTAQKTGERNDYSVFQCWAKSDGRIYLLDQIRGKWESPELLRRARDFWQKWSERGAVKMMVEDKASGTGLIQQLKTEHRIPVFGIQRATDKLTRVQDAMPQIECGNVMLPANTPWVSDFVSECEAFTADNSHAHDDQIDPMCDAIKEFLQTKRVFSPSNAFTSLTTGTSA